MTQTIGVWAQFNEECRDFPKSWRNKCCFSDLEHDVDVRFFNISCFTYGSTCNYVYDTWRAVCSINYRSTLLCRRAHEYHIKYRLVPSAFSRMTFINNIKISCLTSQTALICTTVQGNNCCLLWGSCETRKYSVWEMCRLVWY